MDVNCPLREEDRLMVYMGRVLSRIFGCMREALTGS
jgi:hypothetical protein